MWVNSDITDLLVAPHILRKSLDWVEIEALSFVFAI